MYVLAWTPDFMVNNFLIERYSNQENLIDRLTEIHEATYDDVVFNVYTSISDDEDESDIDTLYGYHNNLSLVEISIEPEKYGARNYHNENIRDARLGKILMKYIDRLNDPVRDYGQDGYIDSLECIVKELSHDVDKEIELQRSEL